MLPSTGTELPCSTSIMTKHDNIRDFRPCARTAHHQPASHHHRSNSWPSPHLTFHSYQHGYGLKIRFCSQHRTDLTISTATAAEHPPHLDHGFLGPRRCPARHDSRGGSAAADTGDSAFEPEPEPNSEWLILFAVLLVALVGLGWHWLPSVCWVCSFVGYCARALSAVSLGSLTCAILTREGASSEHGSLRLGLFATTDQGPCLSGCPSKTADLRDLQTPITCSPNRYLVVSIIKRPPCRSPSTFTSALYTSTVVEPCGSRGRAPRSI